MFPTYFVSETLRFISLTARRRASAAGQVFQLFAQVSHAPGRNAPPARLPTKLMRFRVFRSHIRAIALATHPRVLQVWPHLKPRPPPLLKRARARPVRPARTCEKGSRAAVCSPGRPSALGAAAGLRCVPLLTTRVLLRAQELLKKDRQLVPEASRESSAPSRPHSRQTLVSPPFPADADRSARPPGPTDRSLLYSSAGALVLLQLQPLL